MKKMSGMGKIINPFGDLCMWTYKCKAGLYKSDNLALLLIAIVSHRFTHFLKGEGFVD